MIQIPPNNPMFKKHPRNTFLSHLSVFYKYAVATLSMLWISDARQSSTLPKAKDLILAAEEGHAFLPGQICGLSREAQKWTMPRTEVPPIFWYFRIFLEMDLLWCTFCYVLIFKKCSFQTWCLHKTSLTTSQNRFLTVQCSQIWDSDYEDLTECEFGPNGRTSTGSLENRHPKLKNMLLQAAIVSNSPLAPLITSVVSGQSVELIGDVNVNCKKIEPITEVRFSFPRGCIETLQCKLVGKRTDK